MIAAETEGETQLDTYAIIVLVVDGSTYSIPFLIYHFCFILFCSIIPCISWIDGYVQDGWMNEWHHKQLTHIDKANDKGT